MRGREGAGGVEMAKKAVDGMEEGREGSETEGRGWQVLESMAQQTTRVGPKRRKLEADEDVTGAVRRGEVSEQTLLTRLTEYVERIDSDLVRLAHLCCHAPLCHRSRASHTSRANMRIFPNWTRLIWLHHIC